MVLVKRNETDDLVLLVLGDKEYMKGVERPVLSVADVNQYRSNVMWDAERRGLVLEQKVVTEEEFRASVATLARKLLINLDRETGAMQLTPEGRRQVFGY